MYMYRESVTMSSSQFQISHILNINLIQSEWWSRSPAVVYGPILAKFGEQMGLWTKGAEKYPNFGYLDNCCHGNPKTSSELMKRLKGYGILSGGALLLKKIVAMDFCYHGNCYVVIATKDVCFQVNRLTIDLSRGGY